MLPRLCHCRAERPSCPHPCSQSDYNPPRNVSFVGSRLACFVNTRAPLLRSKACPVHVSARGCLPWLCSLGPWRGLGEPV